MLPLLPIICASSLLAEATLQVKVARWTVLDAKGNEISSNTERSITIIQDSVANKLHEDAVPLENLHNLPGIYPIVVESHSARRRRNNQRQQQYAMDAALAGWEVDRKYDDWILIPSFEENDDEVIVVVPADDQWNWDRAAPSNPLYSPHADDLSRSDNGENRRNLDGKEEPCTQAPHQDTISTPLIETSEPKPEPSNSPQFSDAKPESESRPPAQQDSAPASAVEQDVITPEGPDDGELSDVAFSNDPITPGEDANDNNNSTNANTGLNGDKEQPCTNSDPSAESLPREALPNRQPSQAIDVVIKPPGNNSLSTILEEDDEEQEGRSRQNQSEDSSELEKNQA